jgi:indole-3-glycerol phosphate synthase
MSTELGELAVIAARKAVEVEELRCASAGLWAKATALAPARDIRQSLQGGGVIAEIKRRSPSAGALRSSLDVASLAREYRDGGASALSILTDGPGFGGSLDDLQATRDSVDLPLLRKDFTLDPVQIAEARVAGADWVLLIVALLDDDSLAECLAAAQRCRAHAVVEVHDVEQARRAVDVGAECIGINNRDLRTLSVDLNNFATVRCAIPDVILCVAESGISSPGDVRRMIAEGADAVLVGEALLRADSPGAALRSLVEAAHSTIAQR